MPSLKEIIEDVLYAGNRPMGAGDDSTEYKQLKLKKDIKMSEALGRLKNPLTVQEALEFNFGKEASGQPEVTKNYIAQYSSWIQSDTKELDFGGMSGDSYIWVPASAELKDPGDKSVALGKPPGKPVQEGVAPSKFPAKRTKDSYYAARHQKGQPAAISTVEVGIKAGDILLIHVLGEDYIAAMTTSWPTHAGMAISEQWAVDADDGRNDGEAVKVIEMKRKTDTAKEKGFFEDRPVGGLVYRYVGDGKMEKKRVDEIRLRAAKWAFEQRKRKYRFALRSSEIIDTSKKKKQILEKRFDEKGEAIGEDGKRLRYYSKEEEAYKETPYHNIYCAELVWRAYRHAGVNIVDPKQIDLMANKKQAVPAIIIDNKALITDSQEKELKPLRWLPANFARSIAASKMRKSVHNKFYFCAPYQLASSKLTERVAQLPPSEDKYKTIEFDDFRGCNINPYNLVMALLAKDKEKIEKELRKELAKEKVPHIRTKRAKNKSSSIKKDLDEYMKGATALFTVQSLMAKRKISEGRAKKEVREEYRKQLIQEYDKKTEEEIERVIKGKISDKEIQKRSWEDYKKKNGVKKLQLSVSRPWADAKDEKAVELRFDDMPYDEEVVFPGMAPPFKDTADFK